jgi:hypothetical protein
MVRLLVRWFLVLRRGTASLLAAWAERIAPPPENPAIAALRSRFPGAPEHWLAAIADRPAQLATPLVVHAERRTAPAAAAPAAKRSIEKPTLPVLSAVPAKPPASVAFHPVRRLAIEPASPSPFPIRVGRKEASPAVAPPRLRLHSNETPTRMAPPPTRPDPERIAPVTAKPSPPSRPPVTRPAVERRLVASWTEEVDPSPPTPRGRSALIPSLIEGRTRVRGPGPSRSGIAPDRGQPMARLVADRAPSRPDPFPGGEKEMWSLSESVGLIEQETAPAEQDMAEDASNRWPALPAPTDQAPPADPGLARERERLDRLARDQMERSWNA